MPKVWASFREEDFFQGPDMGSDLDWRGDEVNPLDLSYTAGLFDGEGCISFARKPRASGGYRYSVLVSVEMSDEQSIDFLLDTFGGGKSSYDRPGKKTLYRWYICGVENILSFLMLVEPYVKYKKPQFEMAIEYCQFMLDNPLVAGSSHPLNTVVFQQGVYDAMRELKLR